MSQTRAASERTSQPIAAPAGYLKLASYSSLGEFWRYLGGARRQGRHLSLLRGDAPATCRRRIAGYAVTGAGFCSMTSGFTRS